MGLSVERETLASLEPEWRELLSGCSLRNVFLSPTWLCTWWDVFHDGRELLPLSVREGGRLVAVVPLMRDGETLSFAGDTRICDYMDVAVRPGRNVLGAVLRSVSEEPWREMSLWGLREDSPTLAALTSHTNGLGLAVSVEEEDVCPQVRLPGTWEEYVDGLPKKDRHELRRKLRRLPQAGEVALDVLESPVDVEAGMDDFVRLYAASRADKVAFLTEPMERFFRRISVALAGEGLLELTFLTLDGRRVAAVLCFRGEDEVLLYNSGYDPTFSPFSVGLLSKALTLRRAIEQGKRAFDFLRGPEPYKYDLGARDLKVHRAVIRRT